MKIKRAIWAALTAAAMAVTCIAPTAVYADEEKTVYYVDGSETTGTTTNTYATIQEAINAVAEVASGDASNYEIQVKAYSDSDENEGKYANFTVHPYLTDLR